MRVLLAANASYLPPRGGATRSNLAWMDALAAAGHECVILGSALPDSAERRAQMRAEGMAEPEAREAGVTVGRRGAIEVWSVEDPARRTRLLGERIAAFRPDWTLVSSEDLGHSLLREAQHAAPGRVVYLAHTPQFFPFGPESWNPDPHATEIAARAAAVVVIGHAMAGYVERSLGRECSVVHPPIYGRGPYPRFHNFGRGAVLMINPCAVKGIDIFLDLARRFPDREFATLSGWGVTSADLAAIESLPNVRMRANVRDIDEILAQTRLLLMPSRWFEGFGLIVMEAMLRGIPVIASDSGGLVEAKQGTGYVIPTAPAAGYRAEYDERAMPLPVIPHTDVEPWDSALRELLTDRVAYENESERSRSAALAFVGSLRAEAFEELLRGLAPRAATPAAAEAPHIESLTPAQRALLLERLRRRRAAPR
jgi:glycosyltransferase involved in cell wall biosynthesis